MRALALAGDRSPAPRLPLEVCEMIVHHVEAAEEAQATVRVVCKRCARVLLYEETALVFEANVPIAWAYDGGAWLVTSRGNVLLDYFVDRTTTLSLQGSGGVVVPSETPTAVCVAPADGEVAMRFTNVHRSLRQNEYFKRVGDDAYCARCVLTHLRAQRRYWKAWTTSSS